MTKQEPIPDIILGCFQHDSQHRAERCRLGNFRLAHCRVSSTGAVIFTLILQIIIGRLRRAGKAIDKLFVEPVKLFKDRQARETSLAPMKVLRQALGSLTREDEAVRDQDVEAGIEDRLSG
jgi:hypothetical protein